MNRSSSTAAETRAAHAALTRLPVPDEDFDCYLLIDDTDEDITEIHTLMRERSPRGPEVRS